MLVQDNGCRWFHHMTCLPMLDPASVLHCDPWRVHAPAVVSDHALNVLLVGASDMHSVFPMLRDAAGMLGKGQAGRVCALLCVGLLQNSTFSPDHGALKCMI